MTTIFNNPSILVKVGTNFDSKDQFRIKIYVKGVHSVSGNSSKIYAWNQFSSRVPVSAGARKLAKDIVSGKRFKRKLSNFVCGVNNDTTTQYKNELISDGITAILNMLE